ncbi:hypothetical protein AgCh_018823 [Apium graveolens]
MMGEPNHSYTSTAAKDPGRRRRSSPATRSYHLALEGGVEPPTLCAIQTGGKKSSTPYNANNLSPDSPNSAQSGLGARKAQLLTRTTTLSLIRRTQHNPDWGPRKAQLLTRTTTLVLICRTQRNPDWRAKNKCSTPAKDNHLSPDTPNSP